MSLWTRNCVNALRLGKVFFMPFSPTFHVTIRTLPPVRVLVHVLLELAVLVEAAVRAAVGVRVAAAASVDAVPGIMRHSHFFLSTCWLNRQSVPQQCIHRLTLGLIMIAAPFRVAKGACVRLLAVRYDTLIFNCANVFEVLDNQTKTTNHTHMHHGRC